MQVPASGKICSGVLISRRHVLTAAHCVYDTSKVERKPGEACDPSVELSPLYEIYTYIGSKCPKAGPCDADPHRTVYRADLVLPHPSYDPCTAANDLAIIQLDKNVHPADGSPACLAEKHYRVLGPVAAVGYGMDTRPRPDKDSPGLQVVVLDAVSDDNGKITTRNKNKTTCFGDSGGPLYKNDGIPRAVVYGIASTSEVNCSLPYEEAVNYFIDVRKHLGWICDMTGVCPRFGSEYEQFHIAYDRRNREEVALGINYGYPLPEKERDVSVITSARIAIPGTWRHFLSPLD